MLHPRYISNNHRLRNTIPIVRCIYKCGYGQSCQVRYYLFFWQCVGFGCVRLFLFSTGFLIGFQRQFRNMIDQERRITSALFVGALLGTLFSALVLESKILVIVCLVVQIPSYIWYCATYIPFARDCIKSCLKGCFNKCKK